MSSSSGASCYGGSVGSSKPSVPEPYGGQVFCPVSGAKLGVRGPAVPVETRVGAAKPSFFGKLVGRKPTPGAVVYVCCPECAAQARAAPEAYLGKVIADRAAYEGTYAHAPASRFDLPDAAKGVAIVAGRAR